MNKPAVTGLLLSLGHCFLSFSAYASDLKILEKKFPKIKWVEGSKVSTDLDLDKKMDFGYLGKDAKKSCVGAIVAGNADALCFGVDNTSQSALCSDDSLELRAETDDGSIEITPDKLKLWGCKQSRPDSSCFKKAAETLDIEISELKQRLDGKFPKNANLVLDDGQCDAFRIFWIKDKKALTWQRN